MAHKTVKTKHETWLVKTNVDDILGNGAYGIVYNAFNAAGMNVAAKRIDTKTRQSLATAFKDLERLKQLEHPNVVEVLDLHEEAGKKELLSHSHAQNSRVSSLQL